MSEDKWSNWPPIGFISTEEYVWFMNQTGQWGSKDYAWQKMNNIPIRELRKLRDRFHLVPFPVFYPMQRNIESRTSP